MENVKNFATHDSGNTLEVVKNTMHQLGYNFHAKVLNAADYGVPQKRERIYMICFRNCGGLPQPHNHAQNFECIENIRLAAHLRRFGKQCSFTCDFAVVYYARKRYNVGKDFEGIEDGVGGFPYDMIRSKSIAVWEIITTSII